MLLQWLLIFFACALVMIWVMTKRSSQIAVIPQRTLLRRTMLFVAITAVAFASATIAVLTGYTEKNIIPSLSMLLPGFVIGSVRLSSRIPLIVTVATAFPFVVIVHLAMTTGDPGNLWPIAAVLLFIMAGAIVVTGVGVGLIWRWLATKILSRKLLSQEG